jgi:hypothetical protein
MGSKWTRVFPPSATGTTITTFLTEYVFLCDPTNIQLHLKGTEMPKSVLEPFGGVDSLGLNTRPVSVGITFRTKDNLSVFFQYLYIRSLPPQLIEQVEYRLGCPDDMTVSTACKKLAALIGTDERVVQIREIEGKVLDERVQTSCFFRGPSAFFRRPWRR